MTGVAIAPLSDFSNWARGDLLVIILLILGAALLTRLADWTRGKIMGRIDAGASGTDELVRSEGAKHRHVVAQVLTWSAVAVIYVVTAVLVVEHLGVPLAGLVAPAALISAGLGFGLQRFVQDIGAGFFITGERQYGFGDVVRIHVTGVPEPAFGTVEEVTLRVTRIRSVSGEVIITPNGQICAWWRGRSRACSSTSAGRSVPGWQRPSGGTASSCRPNSTPAVPQGPKHDQTAAPLAPHQRTAAHLDPRARRAVPGRARAVYLGAPCYLDHANGKRAVNNGDLPRRRASLSQPSPETGVSFAHYVPQPDSDDKLDGARRITRSVTSRDRNICVTTSPPSATAARTCASTR